MKSFEVTNTNGYNAYRRLAVNQIICRRYRHTPIGLLLGGVSFENLFLSLNGHYETLQLAEKAAVILKPTENG